MKKRILSILVAVAMVFALLPPVYGQDAGFQVGDSRCGFTVTDVRTFPLIDADVITLRHDKTGALVMLLLNEDTNRVFEINFRTVAENNEGIPHVFEHATLDGSEKYPSKALFFNLSYQTYNTYMNAGTYSIMTAYPMASLSEEQLLKLADYYLDACFYPTLMTDESIFREEAWRYELTDKDAPLTLNGTVYNEMKGALTLSEAAMYNYYRSIAPGSVQGNVFGGDPDFIPDMSWQSLKDYHDTYYHPSNSLSVLYGKIENPDAFLTLMDSVFSGYEYADMSGLFANSAYEPLTEAVEAVYPYAVEAGSDTTNGSEVYYGFRCDGISQGDLDALDLLSTMLNAEGSVFQQLMKQKLPGATANAYVDLGPVPSFFFCASGLNTEDAALFREIVDQSVAEVAENGFSMDEAEAIEAAYKLDILLLPEQSNVGVNLIPNIVWYWAGADRLYGYLETIALLDSFTTFTADGTFCRLAEEYILNNPIHALAVTEPVPGLKEEKEAALAQRLAEKKAGMTEAELDAIVAATNAPEEENVDTDAMVAALNAVTVDTLPEEYRVFDIQETTLDQDVRSYYVPAAAEGLGKTMLRLDISSIPQEQLHWLRLYLDLLGELDTDSHTQAELYTLVLRYASNLNIDIALPRDDSEVGYTPYLRAEFTALDENLESAYALLAEMLFVTDFSNVEMLSGQISNIRIGTKQEINANSFLVLLRGLFGSAEERLAYYDYLNQLPYYDFLCQVEQTVAENPEAVAAGLEEIRSLLQTLGHGAVYGYVGSEEGRAANETAVDGLLSRLSYEQRQRAEYSFPAVPGSQGLIVETNTNFNEVFASWESLGVEKYTADWDVVCALVNDRYLLPELRDARGAYGAYLAANEYGLFVYTYRDPGVAESFEVISRLGEMLRGDTEITQELLDGYILSSYSYYATPNGELTDGARALANLLGSHSQEETLENMRAIKAVTVEKLPEYADVLSRLMAQGVYGTAASASVINANGALYQTVNNPFGAVDTSQVELTDVDESHPNYEEIRAVFEAGFMEAPEGAFLPENGLTLGELAMPLYLLIGGTADAQEAIEVLSGYGILPGEPVDTPLTRDDVVTMMVNFFTAIGLEIQQQPLGDYADADQLSADAVPGWAWMIDNGMLAPREENTLAPQQPMTRAEFACLLHSVMLLFS